MKTHYNENRALHVLRQYWPDVTAVRDARSPLDIHVTADDVMHAKPKDPTACVFALAAQHQGAEAALVTATQAYIKKGREAVRYSLSKSARQQVIVFDWTGECKSESVGFKAPAPSRMLGAQPKGRSYSKRKRAWQGRRKKPQHVSAGLRPSLAQLAKGRA